MDTTGWVSHPLGGMIQKVVCECGQEFYVWNNPKEVHCPRHPSCSEVFVILDDKTVVKKKT